MTPFIRHLDAIWAERPHSLPEAVWVGAEKSLPGIESLPSAVGISTEVSMPTLWCIQQWLAERCDSVVSHTLRLADDPTTTRHMPDNELLSSTAMRPFNLAEVT